MEECKKLIELEGGISIWKIGIDFMEEQDKNARVLPIDKFKRLSETIKKDKRLESLPLVTFSNKKDETNGFQIISGHHRARAARAAGLEYIYVLNIDEPLTKSQIISKQLAHNALSGYDDVGILNELYNEIDNINDKIASGLSDLDLKRVELPSVKADDIKFDFDFEVVNILFLKRQKQKLDEVYDKIEKDCSLYIADREDFDRFKDVIRSAVQVENIRNIAGIMIKFIEIIENYYANRTKS